jgi:dipeptidyl aminopeptidase/acylaminoacyl peptidase
VALLAATRLLAAEASAAPGRALELPSYDSVQGLAPYGSREAYAVAAGDRRFVMEQIRYPSDGLTVLAYVYRPAASGRRLPVIVFNRGSWTWESFHAQLLVMAHRLAKAGYVVVAPMYRGSGGAPGRDEMGGADLDDLLNLRPVLATLPGVDPARVYLYGESRGGMMVYQALRSGFPARAAAVFGAFTDLEGMLAAPKGLEMARKIWPAELEQDRKALVERRSALCWPERISAPVLIMHGGADRSCPPEQSLKMAEALQAAGKPYELKIFHGEGHILSGRAEERDQDAVRWFQRFP